MNWKSAALWLVLGLAVWFVASTVAGMVFGLLSTSAGPSPILRALGGMLVPVLFFVRYVLVLVAGLCVPILLWAVLARRFPVLESSRARMASGVSLLALAVAAVVWFVFPLDRSLAIWAAGFAALSVATPRFMTKRLAPGRFSA